MYRNTNKECVKELGYENYKAHPDRNRMAILAVILTTILISMAFTVGLTIYNTVYMSESAAPGPGCDSNGFYGSYENAQKARALPQVEWAAYVRRCSVRMLQNKEFSGLEVRLFAPDGEHYEKNMVNLISGSYPAGENELLVSDTFAKRFGISGENSEYKLIVAIETGEKTVEKEISFRVCGIYKNPLANISNIYEEVYTADSFVDIYNPELPEGLDTIYVKLNNLSFFKFVHDKTDRLQEVNDAAGGNGTTYKMSDTSGAVIIPLILLILVIMLCGYFFIYNVFYISIVNDIRFYGELKTIGMTSKQLCSMLSSQLRRIGLWGISIGCLIGYLIGKLAAKALVPAFMENIKEYYQPTGFLQVFAVTIVFSWVTVYISTMKPFRLAGGISPIEAARYRGKGKKGVFTVISFCLGGLLFFGVYTLTIGYDVDAMVTRYNQADFRITHKASIWTQDEPYKPFPQELAEKIEALSGVRDKRVFYRARTKPDFYDFGNERTYNESLGEIKKEGELAEDIEEYNSLQEPGSSRIFKENERGNYMLEIAGAPAESLREEERYLKVLEGKIDGETFATGDYLIYQCKAAGGGNAPESFQKQVHAGDKVSLSFYDDEGGRYVDKSFTVMAVIEAEDMFGTGNISNNHVILLDKVFRDIYTDYANLVSCMQFNMENGMDKEQYEIIKELVQDYGNLQLKFDSKYKTLYSQAGRKNIMRAVGFFLSVLVGMIGVSNMVNTVSTDVLARKLEFAAMQSIGMTKKQMLIMIFLQSLKYGYLSILLALILGAPLVSMLGSNPLFTGFSLSAFLQSAGILLFITTLICGLCAFILTRQLNRLPVAERLREIV